MGEAISTSVRWLVAVYVDDGVAANPSRYQQRAEDYFHDGRTNCQMMVVMGAPGQAATAERLADRLSAKIKSEFLTVLEPVSPAEASAMVAAAFPAFIHGHWVSSAASEAVLNLKRAA
jgi:hypothetical protein